MCDKAGKHPRPQETTTPEASILINAHLGALEKTYENGVPTLRGYMDILKDPKQLRFFEHFLSTKGNNSEARLQFWLAVEDLKSIHKKSTLRHQIAKIEQRFLGRKAEKRECMMSLLSF